MEIRRGVIALNLLVTGWFHLSRMPKGYESPSLGGVDAS